MVFTIVMFLVLIAIYAAMLGLVKFSEGVIATPALLVTPGDGTAKAIESAKVS